MSIISKGKRSRHTYYKQGRSYTDSETNYTVRNWQQTGSGATWLIGKDNTSHSTHEDAINEAKKWSPFIWSADTNQNHSTTSQAQPEQKCPKKLTAKQKSRLSRLRKKFKKVWWKR